MQSTEDNPCISASTSIPPSYSTSSYQLPYRPIIPFIPTTYTNPSEPFGANSGQQIDIPTPNITPSCTPNVVTPQYQYLPRTAAYTDLPYSVPTIQPPYPFYSSSPMQPFSSAADVNIEDTSTRTSTLQNGRSSGGKRKRNDIDSDNGKKMKPEDAEDDTNKWTREETLDLIECVGEIYESLKKEKSPTQRGNLWKKAFTEFNIRHPSRTMDAVKMKWERLIAKYREVVRHNKKSGVAPKNWDYQSHMADILKEDPSHHPSITSDIPYCPGEEKKKGKDRPGDIVRMIEEINKKSDDFFEYHKKRGEEQDRLFAEFMKNNSDRNDLLRSILAKLN